MFRGIGGTSQCTQDCFNELTALTRIVQIACAGHEASGTTVIGHLFFGDADRWLCGFQTAPVGTAEAGTTAAAETTAAASTDAASTEAASTTAAAEENSSSTSTETTTAAASETESEAESTTTEASLTTTTLETSTISTTSETERTTSTAVATAVGSTDNDQIGITGGGSPFDIALPARGAASSGRASRIGVVMVALLGTTVMVL